jgi:hypothetical protein
VLSAVSRWTFASVPSVPGWVVDRTVPSAGCECAVMGGRLVMVRMVTSAVAHRFSVPWWMTWMSTAATVSVVPGS